jgi:pSer/pThr/pTyr-binding forkhead associated (FHA) protein
VVPKALSPFSEEEDEKTTIESGWEEEASTTVEQGEVAEKIRALGLDAPRRQHITNVTSTSSNNLDEPTVDDQRANAALSLITPQAVLARLVITQGNDSGQEIEVIPGKTYTIGRAIDNDVVLTDIAVSRKHFDLRNEEGAWIVVDRGSGNGTLVNGNVEDQPFMLANGDAIEIGNTTFRFDNPNGMSREPANATYDVDLDEEEPSTVAGKPLRDDIATPSQIPSPVSVRPKTVPPPAPLPRPRPQSGPPPMSSPGMHAGLAMPLVYPQGSLPASMQPTISPHQGMQALQHPPMHHSGHTGIPPLQYPPPVGTPIQHMAQMQQRPMPMLGSQQPTMLGAPHENGMMPTTIPGQGPPVHPSQPHVQALPFTYPNINDQAHHAQMLVIASQNVGRDSTAHVPPTPYNGMPAMMQGQYAAQPNPSFSRRTKLLLGGAALTLLAALATVAIIKGSSSNKATAEPAPAPKSGSAAKPNVQPIVETKVAKTEPPKVEPPKVEKPPTITPAVEKKPDPQVEVKVPPTITPTVEKKPDPPKVEVKVEKKPDPPKVEPKVEKKPDPPKVEKKPDPPKVAKVEPKVEKKPPKQPPPKKERPAPPPKKVAAATPSDTSSAFAAAAELFKARNFNGAAASLRASAAGFSGSDATELKSRAGTYEQFGRKFNVGIASGTAPPQAWDLLISAKNLDRDGVFRSDIQDVLSKIATKAALGFISAKNYNRALEAVKIAEAGGPSGSTKIVRQSIESYASDLYDAAAKEFDTDRAAATGKLRQIKGLVGEKSPLYAKANKLLAGA